MTLRRLKLVGVVLPVLFVAALELVRLTIVEQGFAAYTPHIVLAAIAVLAVVAFSLVMFHLIARAQAETAHVVTDLRRRQREGHAFYDVLLQISHQEPLADILAAVARHSRELLSTDQAAVWLNEPVARSVQLGATPAIVTGADESYGLHELRHVRSLSWSAQPGESLRVPVQGSDGAFGELWVARRSTMPFQERDREFLSTFSGFASIAVTGARMRERERQTAILAERERLARELHDSLAQVLGAVHLRLRGLAEREEDLAPAIALELIELADVCEEGYADARGAILDLHESSRVDRSLLDSLRAYLDKYSRQCGIDTSLETSLEQELSLTPRSEVQIIRVIQEALANVRKHSGAAAATVQVSERGGTVTFLVEDDGRGFDVTAELSERGGFGLHAMRERMEMIGGTLCTESASGHGTRVIAELPNAHPRVSAPFDLACAGASQRARPAPPSTGASRNGQPVHGPAGAWRHEPTTPQTTVPI